MAMTMAMAGVSTYVPTGLAKPLRTPKNPATSLLTTFNVPHCKPRTVCSASEEKNKNQSNYKSSNAFANISTALALAAVMAAAPVVVPTEARADISGLTLCKDSKAFAKREKQSLKKLESSLKPYAPDSAPALAIKASIEKTKKRFDNYKNEGLLCGTDGLPHLVVDGDQAHWGEFILPGVGFLYVAGWIGWVGRSYLIAVRGDKKPTQKEIVIDVPLASRVLWRGIIWPLAALNEVRSGTLVEDDANITVSPR